MEQNEINPTPIYWDGESALFVTDSKTGNVHILRESGSPLEIAERKWAEAAK
jgi:hypothetical protein